MRDDFCLEDGQMVTSYKVLQRSTSGCVVSVLLSTASQHHAWFLSDRRRDPTGLTPDLGPASAGPSGFCPRGGGDGASQDAHQQHRARAFVAVQEARQATEQ